MNRRTFKGFAVGFITVFSAMKYRERKLTKELEKTKRDLKWYRTPKPRCRKIPKIELRNYNTESYSVTDDDGSDIGEDTIPKKIFNDINNGKIQHHTLELPKISTIDKLSVVSQFVENELDDILDPLKKKTFISGSSFGDGTAKIPYFAITKAVKDSESGSTQQMAALIKYNPKTEKAEITLYPKHDSVPREDIPLTAGRPSKMDIIPREEGRPREVPTGI